MWVGAISLMPDMFAALDAGVVGRAKEKGLWSLNLFQPRDFTNNIHRTVDDTPYGGGPGMVMKAEPLLGAIDAAKAAAPGPAKVVYLSPQGRPVTQALLAEAAKTPNWIFLSGRYEGIDERVIDIAVDEEWSLGDFVISGGEIATMAIIDGMIRLLPGALGDEDSAKWDSFSTGLLDHPHYTRPETVAGRSTPKVLLSGDHKAIARWRRKQALGRTWMRRKALLTRFPLSAEDEALLTEFKLENDNG